MVMLLVGFVQKPLKNAGRGALAVTLVSAGLFGASASAAIRAPVAKPGHHIQGTAVLRVLNGQRSVNGIPSFTKDQQNFASAWCPREGAAFPPGEWEQDWSPRDTWNKSTTPYLRAPLHQQALYNPLFTVMGDQSYKGQDCFGAGGPVEEPSSPHFYMVIQAQGRHNVPTSELAEEGPFTPGQLVGIRAGTTTGPYIILYATGLPGECGYCGQASSSAEISAYSLKRTGGAVVAHVKMVDPGIADKHANSRGYLFGDVAFLIPPKLPKSSSFTGSVTWKGPNGHTYTQKISFTTRR